MTRKVSSLLRPRGFPSYFSIWKAKSIELQLSLMVDLDVIVGKKITRWNIQGSMGDEENKRQYEQERANEMRGQIELDFRFVYFQNWYGESRGEKMTFDDLRWFFWRGNFFLPKSFLSATIRPLSSFAGSQLIKNERKKTVLTASCYQSLSSKILVHRRIVGRFFIPFLKSLDCRRESRDGRGRR